MSTARESPDAFASVKRPLLVVVESPFNPQPEQLFPFLSIPVGEYRDHAEFVRNVFRVSTAEGHARALLRTRNTFYARAAMLDSLSRGESPYLSHLLYTQVWSDDQDEERAAGMEAGRAWIRVADAHAFYTDLGMSPGMTIAKNHTLGVLSTFERKLRGDAVNWYFARVPKALRGFER